MTGPNPQPDQPDDVEGHRLVAGGRIADSAADEEDEDVAGHVQPPRDPDHLDR